MLSLKGDLHKETKGTPKSFERSRDEDTAILKNYEFEENWELSIYQVTKLRLSFSAVKTSKALREMSVTQIKRHNRNNLR